MTETLNSITLNRRFDASPQAVFDAWTDPKTAGRWLFTSPTSEAHDTRLDARVGGKWTITDRRDGVDYAAHGEYQEIDRPRRLVFTFGMPQFSPAFNKVIVTFKADGDGCLMTLIQEGLPHGHEAPTIDGWEKMFDAMTAVLA